MTMFPNANPNADEEEEEIKWTVEGLQESLENDSSWFRKVTVGSDCYAGFAVWTLQSSSGKTRRGQTRTRGVQTEHGIFTSMFRESKPYVGQEMQAGFVDN
ncbi:hypothetical protein O988_01246 [Pseudogymnoascus sp. VKM F-3808]|nr:hypothetical protein O988_01246 [Pseudogymnoascus sp. VKM F-3808]